MLRRRPARFWLGRRGSASVEFALVATFVLLPLFAGSANMLEVLSAQAQVNTSLQSLYYFAMMNPANASGTAQAAKVLALINANSLHQVALGNSAANGQVTYDCDNGGAITSSTGTCSAGILQSFVSYQVTSAVNLTLPFSAFGLLNPFPLSASGTVQTQ